MKPLLRQAVAALPAPMPVWIQGAVGSLRYPQVRERERMQRRILSRLETPVQVSQGPFRGMRYLAPAYGLHVLPKLVGTYECELADSIETICRLDCDRIVDIGTAEGYYAVGMAWRNPHTDVIGFEINPSARYYLRRLARLNGISGRFAIRGACTLDALGESLAGARRPAVICDCEGAEDRLLDPERIEPLRRAWILVETHDGLETGDGVLEGIVRRLHERFAATHDIEVIDSRARRREELPADCADFSESEAAEAMNESRPWAQWLFLTPRAASVASDRA